MKSVKIPDEMMLWIKGFLEERKDLGYESTAEFVRSAIRRAIFFPDQNRHIEKLVDCAYRRNVACLQHRTIHEFAQFVDAVMEGIEGYEQYQFDFNSHDAICIWIDKFYEYCKKEHQ